jgi:iron(III) transport system substrate-binding protein
MRMSRRMAAIGLGTSALLPGRARADMDALAAAARKEGGLTWYVAQMGGEAAESMGKRFTQRYPGIAVSVIRTTGQVAYERLQQELKNNTPHCDVFSSTDIAHYPVLKARGALARYTPQSVGDTKNVKPEDVPKRCTDLYDPKFKNRLALGHPAFSGYFGQWVLAMRKQYGWAFFEKIEKNKPRIGRSGNDPIAMLNANECFVGTGPVSTAIQNAEKGNPIGFVYPEDGAVLCVGPSAILANAQHPAAGRLFMEWLLSLDYAEGCKEWHLEPVRVDAPRMTGAKNLSEIKTVGLTAAEIAKSLPEAVEQWRDTFGN